MTFYGRVVGGAIAASDESTEVRFVGLDELAGLPVHDTVRCGCGIMPGNAGSRT